MSVGGIGPRVTDTNATTSATGTSGAAPIAPAPARIAAGSLRDAAFAKAFPRGLEGEVRQGASGDQAVAIQYALGRLGHLHDLVDGRFGPKTAAAVRAFQKEQGLPETGAVNPATLAALDAAATALPKNTPAARAANPLSYLSEFSRFDLSRVTIADRTKPVDWNHPEVRAAYGRFTEEYWPALKANRVEADCKTMALFFMDQFRKKMKADTGVDLQLPGNAQTGRLPRATWSTLTAARPGGIFSRFDSLPKIRPGYEAGQKIQKLDPSHSMVYGVNVRYAGPNANLVARAATPVAAWNPALDNRGDRTKPEIPLKDASVGDMIFIDHTGDGTWDHTVNIVGMKRDAQGRPTQVTMAVGSFDDMKDADGATAPTFREVNNYAEEVVCDLDPATGKITRTQVTWSSEPDWLTSSRYSERTTLMELKPGGKLMLARWGEPPPR